MHLFYNASQIKMTILVDLSAIFWHLHSQFWHLHCQFQSFSGTQSICCSPASVRQNIAIPNEYRMLGSFVRTLPVKFHQLLVRLQKTLMTLATLYSESNLFRTFLPRLIRPPRNTPSKLSLVSTWHMPRMTRNWYIYTRHTALRHFDSPSNPCAANWFPCFKEKRHRPVPSKMCSGDFKSPPNKLLYSNVGDYEFGDFFSFLFFFCKRLSE